MKQLAAIVLAAGKGRRMKSDLPKVLHEIKGRPLVTHVLETLDALTLSKIVVVIGYKADQVREVLKDRSLEFVLQERQLGTGHAVLVTESIFQGFHGDILVLAGDVPFLTAKTLKVLLETHRREKAAATVLSAKPPDPAGYGRIIRVPGTDRVDYIVEDREASENERQIDEINTGTMCFDSANLFEALREVSADNSQGEYYLTDVIEILNRRKLTTAVCLTSDPVEAMGVNSAEQMAELEARVREKSPK
jgi:bifunctional UDP-N-acetylglucosamine pyrophosphorylase/glucosamine-1-phosphate N-acetyltransferase